MKGVLVDMGYYEWRSQDVQPTAKTSSNGAGGHRVYVHLMQVREWHIWEKATCIVRFGDGLQTHLQVEIGSGGEDTVSSRHS